MSFFAHTDGKVAAGGCLGFVGFFAASVVVLLAWAQSRTAPSVAWVLLGVCSLVLLIFLVFIWRSEKRIEEYQMQRNNLAKEIRDLVMTGQDPAPPYFVYLRPFDIDGAFVEAPRDMDSEHIGSYMEEYGLTTSHHDLESALALLVYPFGKLVALSDKPGDAGAGYVRGNEKSWRNEIRALCEHAEGVFVVPFDRDGTAWEVEMLDSHGWLNKCFFVMPARPPLGLRGLGYRKLWEAGRARYKMLKLPDYDPNGGMVVVGDEVQVLKGFGKKKHFLNSARSNAHRKQVERDLATLRSRIADLVAGTDSDDASLAD